MASLSSAGETTSPDATAETVRLTVAQALESINERARPTESTRPPRGCSCKEDMCRP
jgi:hypothetical protein